MKVLILGSGGREHVLAWKIKQSPKCTKLYCAPGNGGIAAVAQCVDIPVDDISALIQFVKGQKIDLTIVGPEAPLVSGIVDAFESEGLMIFGPGRLAARLEGSKIFAKEFMQRRNIPTAQFRSFNNAEAARSFLRQASFPLVIKADGLAGGKGVVICQSLREGESTIVQMMEERIFQDAGSRILIEECLDGQEVSILAISDGDGYVILESAQDHKRIFDDDVGPNTGGMGAYSPAPIVTEALAKKIEARIIEPTIRGMKREGVVFKGVLYAGLMITEEGPKVLEYNVRFGDPEAQAVIPRLKSDLLSICLASCQGRLAQMSLEWDHRNCVCVIMSSGGYPGAYETGKPISGLDDFRDELQALIFHSGTKRMGDQIVTSGGRVLGVTALGRGLNEALKKVYQAVDAITFDRCFFRRDIGAKALKNSRDPSQPASQG
jgi:phosphoribosylamine--glycine ligase